MSGRLTFLAIIDPARLILNHTVTSAPRGGMRKFKITQAGSINRASCLVPEPITLPWSGLVLTVAHRAQGAHEAGAEVGLPKGVGSRDF
jgi:hypothetical protein